MSPFLKGEKMYVNIKQDSNKIVLRASQIVAINKENYLLLKIFGEYVTLVNNKYKSNIKFERKLADMYDFGLNVSVNFYGSHLLLTYSFTGINFDMFKDLGFTNNDVIDLVNEYVNNPLIRNQTFVNKYVTLAKEIIITQINEIKENYQTKAFYNSIDSYLDYKGVNFNFLLSEEDVNDVSADDLYNFYLKYIQNNKIYYYTNILSENILLNENYTLNFTDKISYSYTDTYKYKYVPSNIDEVCVFYYLSIDTNPVVLRLLNDLIGGDSNSLLFSNIREENQLCYLISSTNYNSLNNIVITLLTSKDLVRKANELVKDELSKLDISEENFMIAKKKYISSLMVSHDNISNELSYIMFNNLYKNLKYEEVLEFINKLSFTEFKDEVNKLKLEYIYQVGGNDENL